MNKLIQTYFDDGMRDATTLASIGFTVLLIILFYLTGLFSLANTLLLGLVLVYLVAILIRTLYYKERPTPKAHRSWIERIDASSFPSIHSARIFLLVTLLTYPYTAYTLTIFLFLLALFVGYTRVYLKKHYWSDVLAGAALGIIVGAFLAYGML